MPVHFDADKGCHVIKFEMRVDGRRIRKTKRMPPGIDYDQAIQIERRMMSADDPHYHLRPTLQALKAKPEDPGWIYACISGNGPVKIGMTRTSVGDRLRSFNVSSAEPWQVIRDVRVRNVEDVERAVHHFLASKRLSSKRELFAISRDEADSLMQAVASEIEWISPGMEARLAA